MNYCNLVQCVTLKNASGNVIDLLFVPVNCMFTVEECVPIVMTNEMHHPPLKITIRFGSDKLMELLRLKETIANGQPQRATPFIRTPRAPIKGQFKRSASIRQTITSTKKTKTNDGPAPGSSKAALPKNQPSKAALPKNQPSVKSFFKTFAKTTKK